MDERVELLVMDYKAGRYTRRQMMRKAIGLGISASGLSMLLEMVGDLSPLGMPRAAEAAAASRTLVVGIPENIQNPDPPAYGGYGDIKVFSNNITEGVVRYKTGTVDLEPCLAKSWDISPDGLTYTFYLRPAFFQDGTPVTAESIKLSYERQYDNNNPYHFPGIVYAEMVFSTVSKVEAVNSTTVRVTQTRPAVTLLPNLAIQAEGIVSPAALEKYNRDFAMHPTGSGPYQFERWTKGVEFVETAFDRYWGGRPWVDRVIWKTVVDNTVRLEQLRTGELDVTTELEFKDVGSLRSDKQFKVVTGPFLATQYILLQEQKAPFDKHEVRQAVQFAINKTNIGKVSFFGNYTIGAGPVPPGVSGYDKTLEKVYPYDPVRAKALLQKAGVANLAFALTHKTEGFWPEIAQLIQSDLQAVGFTVSLRGLDEAAFYKSINANEHQAGLTDWVMDTGDPDNIMFSLFTTDRAKRMGYKNPEVDKLNLAAQVERNPDKRREMYIQAQHIILDDAPFVTLGYTRRAFGTKAGVEGLLVGPLGDVVIRGVKIS